MRKLVGGAAVIVGFGFAAAIAAQTISGFEFSPVPRWQAEPESEELCKAIRAECPALAAKGDIDADMAFDEIYDVKGRLAGMRLVRSTGCKPLDESTMLGRKGFRQRFEEDGSSSLDDLRIELRAGTDPAAVRIIKRVDNMQIGMGC